MVRGMLGKVRKLWDSIPLGPGNNLGVAWSRTGTRDNVDQLSSTDLEFSDHGSKMLES